LVTAGVPAQRITAANAAEKTAKRPAAGRPAVFTAGPPAVRFVAGREGLRSRADRTTVGRLGAPERLAALADHVGSRETHVLELMRIEVGQPVSLANPSLPHEQDAQDVDEPAGEAALVGCPARPQGSP
jgi:hypothetical protein